MDEVLYRRLYALEDSHWWFRGRRAVLHGLLARVAIPRSPRILDAGCGTGRNLTEFAPLGPIEGVDSSDQAVEFCRRRGLTEVKQARLEDLPFDDDSFDLVISTDVLEHVDDDLAALRELRRVTTANGLLLATVPAYAWLWSHHDDLHHHKRRYTRQVLLARAGEARWAPTLSTYFNSALFPAIALVRAGARRNSTDHRTDLDLTPRRLNPILEWPMRLEAKLIARGIRLPFGLSIGMVCRANESLEPARSSASGSDRRRAARGSSLA
jgi:SAM-dependent methyltransferase